MLREKEVGASVSLMGSSGNREAQAPQKVLILGKCHVRSIAACWTALRPEDAVEAVTWTGLRKGRWGIDTLCDYFERADVIVSQAGLGAVADTRPFARSSGSEVTQSLGITSSTEERHRITALLDRAILYPRWSFSGFHPDMGRADESAYSELALAAFTLGLPKERVASLYNAYIYASLGYFDECAKAERYGIGQGQACGLDLDAARATHRAQRIISALQQTGV